jgi:uncharacterized protein YutE (UPF0331/DUF86 family)
MKESLQNEILKELIELIEAEINLLKQKTKIPFSQYLNNWELQHIVERAFQNAIQACIDIGARMIAKFAFRKPDSYHEIFDILFEKNIISADVRDRMHELVGFRNALVHQYRIIDSKEVYRHLKENLDIFKEFINLIIETNF